MSKISFFKLKGKLQFIQDLQVIQRNNAPELYKKMLTLETPDGQILYAELRNHKVNLIEKNDINVQDDVLVEFSFQGSEKNGKRYNNIYINSIQKIVKSGN